MNNSDSYIIRSIEKKDAEQVFDLLNNLDEDVKRVFHPHSFDYETIKNICKNKKDHYFIMEKNNQVIGYSFLRLFGYENPSFGIVIRKGFSNEGYGTILTKWTIEKARKLGYKKIILKTYKENLPAQRIYEKLGFKIVGDSEDKKQYRMELNL